jgi:hypothetical protein
MQREEGRYEEGVRKAFTRRKEGMWKGRGRYAEGERKV